DGPVAVNNRRGLYGDNQVLKLARKKRGGGDVGGRNLVGGGGGFDGRGSRIHNRITLPDVQGGEVVLRSPQGHVFQVANVGLVEVKRGRYACASRRQSEGCQTSTESREGLLEDGIRLVRQLRQQC